MQRAYGGKETGEPGRAEGRAHVQKGGSRCRCAGWPIQQGPDLLLTFAIACKELLPFSESSTDFHSSHEARELRLDPAISSRARALST